MNQDRFIELLNLYVDNEISTQEALELEMEIQSDASRRQVYEQYCRMQRASVLLFENARSQAPRSPALARALQRADRQVSGTSTPFWTKTATFVTFATAACFAVVAVHFNQPAKTSQPAVAVTPLAPAEAAPTVAATATAPVELFSAKAFSLDYNTEGASYSADKVDYLKWTDQVQFRPISKVNPQSVVFAPNGESTTTAEDPAAAPAVTAEPTQEMTAIQFKH